MYSVHVSCCHLAYHNEQKLGAERRCCIYIHQRAQVNVPMYNMSKLHIMGSILNNRKKIQNWVQIYQSMQSGVGKLSCSKTALKRCTSTETLWNRKAPSLSSPEDEEIFLPKLPKSWHADVFKGLKVSIILLFLSSHTQIRVNMNFTEFY